MVCASFDCGECLSVVCIGSLCLAVASCVAVSRIGPSSRTLEGQGKPSRLPCEKKEKSKQAGSFAQSVFVLLTLRSLVASRCTCRRLGEGSLPVAGVEGALLPEHRL